MPAYRLWMPLLGSIVLGMTAATPSAMADDNCDQYGKIALQQQKGNEAEKCGLSGQEWSTDLKGHIDWCMKVGPEKWKEQLRLRAAALAGCKTKK